MEYDVVVRNEMGAISFLRFTLKLICGCCLVYIYVSKLLDEDMTDELATVFYKGIRGGIMHQGQTTESTALVLDGGSREYRIEFLRQF